MGKGRPKEIWYVLECQICKATTDVFSPHVEGWCNAFRDCGGKKMKLIGMRGSKNEIVPIEDMMEKSAK
jgi:hypothetical protein